jgi:hypothetical protein
MSILNPLKFDVCHVRIAMPKLLMTLFLCCLMVTSAGTAWSKDTVLGFDKAGSKLSNRDLIPHLSSKEYYGEKYTFDADFGKRGSFYFSMSITNIGIGDHKMHAKGVLKIDGEKFRWSFKKDNGDWSYDKKNISIKAGGASLSGSIDNLIFTAKHKGSKVMLTFKPLAQSWKPHKGGLNFGKKLKTQYHLFPLSNVTGIFKHKGKEDVLTGLGWGTHTWSHLGPHEQSLWTTQFRGIDLSQKKTVYYRQIKTPTDYGKKYLSYMVVTDHNKLVFQGFGFKPDVSKYYVDKKHDNKYKIAHEFIIKAQDIKDKSKTLNASFSVVKTRLKRNPIANYSWPLRKLMERFSKPMEYAYDMKYQVTVKGGGVDFKSTSNKGRLEVYHFNK